MVTSFFKYYGFIIGILSPRRYRWGENDYRKAAVRAFRHRFQV